jgi:hypothetical protein
MAAYKDYGMDLNKQGRMQKEVEETKAELRSAMVHLGKIF